MRKFVIIFLCVLSILLVLLLLVRSLQLSETIKLRVELHNRRKDMIDIWNTKYDPNAVEICGPDLIGYGDLESPESKILEGKFGGKILDGIGRYDSRGILFEKYGGFGQEIKFLTPPDVLLVTAWIKTENLNGQVYLCIQCDKGVPLHIDDDTMVSFVKSDNFNGTNPWTKITLAALIPPHVDEIRFGGRGKVSGGYAYFDDIQVYPATKKYQLADTNN